MDGRDSDGCTKKNHSMKPHMATEIQPELIPFHSQLEAA